MDVFEIIMPLSSVIILTISLAMLIEARSVDRAAAQKVSEARQLLDRIEALTEEKHRSNLFWRVMFQAMKDKRVF